MPPLCSDLVPSSVSAAAADLRLWPGSGVGETTDERSAKAIPRAAAITKVSRTDRTGVVLHVVRSCSVWSRVVCRACRQGRKDKQKRFEDEDLHATPTRGDQTQTKLQPRGKRTSGRREHALHTQVTVEVGQCTGRCSDHPSRIIRLSLSQQSLDARGDGKRRGHRDRTREMGIDKSMKCEKRVCMSLPPPPSLHVGI